MIRDNPASLPLRSMLFQLNDIEYIDRPGGWVSETTTPGTFTLLLVVKGSGTFCLQDEPYGLQPDKVYLARPGASMRIEADAFHPIGLYRISFTAIQTDTGGAHTRGSSDDNADRSPRQPEIYTGDLLPGRVELAAYPAARLTRLTKQLCSDEDKQSELDWFKRHISFQELLGFLLEQNLPSDQLFHPTRSVENTIDYMRNHYTHNITVRQLARLAHVSDWQYTPIFQELTGKKPLDYLTELRIDRAKELLRDLDEPLREIARRVGFADEYYFNRRFRQTTGVTPGQYARAIRSQVYVQDWSGHEVAIPAQPARIVYHGETFGDLLALGVTAVGSGHVFHRNAMFKERLGGVQDIGFQIDLAVTKALEPDLIIISDPDERRYSTIAHIAPTVTFDTFAPLEQRLHTLGNWLGKQKEASSWLERYNSRADLMWRKLQPHLKPGETASVLIYEHGPRLFAMSSAGLPSALYHPSGFRPPEPLRHAVDEGVGFVEINPDDLPQYAGDRVFMLLSHNPESRRAAEAMMSSERWRSLPAARQNRVHVLEAATWNYGDAWTRAMLLNLLPRLLLRSS